MNTIHEKKLGLLFSLTALLIGASGILVLIATQSPSLVWSRAILKTGKGVYAVTAHLSLNPQEACIQAFLDQDVGKMISQVDVQQRLPSNLPVSNSYKQGKIVDFCGPIDHRMISILASLSDGFVYNVNPSQSDMIVTVMQLLLFGLWLSFSLLLISLLLTLFVLSSPSSAMQPVCGPCTSKPHSILAIISWITLSSILTITILLGVWSGIHDRFFKRESVSGVSGWLSSGFFVLVSAIVTSSISLGIFVFITHQESILAQPPPPLVPPLPIVVQPMPTQPPNLTTIWGDEALLATESCEIVSPPTSRSR
jgi:hypothetical protein